WVVVECGLDRRKHDLGTAVAVLRPIQADPFMRPFLVVGAAKRIEEPLLPGDRPRRVNRGLLFECAVHPLVDTVVFGMTGAAEERGDSVLHQTDAQARKTALAGSAERHTVIAVHRLWQAMLTEHSFQSAPSLLKRDSVKSIACQHIATVRIRHRQRVAIPSTAKAKLAFEIDRDHVARPFRCPRPSRAYGR